MLYVFAQQGTVGSLTLRIENDTLIMNEEGAISDYERYNILADSGYINLALWGIYKDSFHNALLFYECDNLNFAKSGVVRLFE